MDSRTLFIDPTELSVGFADDRQPLLLVDLDRFCDDIPDLDLPPCPVIGVGDSRSPLASRLDAVVESPVTLDMLMRSVSAAPLTAGVVVQLLRALEGCSLDSALVQESMAYGLLQGSAEHARWLGTRPVPTPAAPGIVHVGRVDDRLELVLDRAMARNAIDTSMRDALYEAFMVASLDLSITAVTLRGAGKAFCTGADLGEFGTTRDPALAHDIRMRTLPARALIGCRERLSVHVQGACIGAGLEMAAFATRLSAAPDAWFQLPELAMGLLPGAGGCVSVSRRIGRQRAALMILSGRRISARTALLWGLIDDIV